MRPGNLNLYRAYRDRRTFTSTWDLVTNLLATKSFNIKCGQVIMAVSFFVFLLLLLF